MVMLLLACHGDHDHDHESGHAHSGHDHTGHEHTGHERPLLSSPAEAQDLDPADDVVRVALAAAPLGELYAYNGQIPGPTLRLERGDTLVVDFTNQLDVPTTIHWHGLHVPYDMDGVTWSSAPVGPGESFTYTFTVDQVGTYWYHPHFDTSRQVDLGLYGVVVVEDPDAPDVDELVVVFDSWAEQEEHDDAEHDHLHSEPVDWTANGLADPLFEADGPVLARLVNASNTGYVAVASPGRQVGGDQGWLASPLEPDVLVLAPGDRVELEWTDERQLVAMPWTLQGGETLGDPSPLFEVRASGEPLSWPTTGLAPTPDPGTTDIVYVFQGGPEGWLINGEAFPDVTIEEVPLGDEVIVEVRNLSPTNHPFHLHGMDFEVLSVNGVVPSGRTLRDNLDVPVHGVVRLRLEADNPGDWMTHCHILTHAEGGMMTVLRVTE